LFNRVECLFHQGAGTFPPTSPTVVLFIASLFFFFPPSVAIVLFPLRTTKSKLGDLSFFRTWTFLHILPSQALFFFSPNPSRSPPLCFFFPFFFLSKPGKLEPPWTGCISFFPGASSVYSFPFVHMSVRALSVPAVSFLSCFLLLSVFWSPSLQIPLVGEFFPSSRGAAYLPPLQLFLSFCRAFSPPPSFVSGKLRLPPIFFFVNFRFLI